LIVLIKESARNFALVWWNDPKKSVAMCRDPFVLSLSKHEWFTAPSPVEWLPKPRSPFDKALLSEAEGLRANGVLEGTTDFLG
jgi:hypothetical protein